jgi:hypothetical protein
MKCRCNSTQVLQGAPGPLYFGVKRLAGFPVRVGSPEIAAAQAVGESMFTEGELKFTGIVWLSKVMQARKDGLTRVAVRLVQAFRPLCRQRLQNHTLVEVSDGIDYAA